MHDTPEQVAAAWLHDAVEDGHIRAGTLGAIFPRSVVAVVVALTRDRQRETYAQYIHRLIDGAQSPNPAYKAALLVKLADLQDHLDPRLKPAPLSLRKRYAWAIQKVEAHIINPSTRN
jgi:(p)ppGpp synthase/HD superfamily hydrolase